eukprot:4673743-Heterocapsa_arctica.AAC.1
MVPWLRMLPSGFVDNLHVEKPQLCLQIVDHVRHIHKLRVSLLPVYVPKSKNALNDIGLRNAVDLAQDGVVLFDLTRIQLLHQLVEDF